MKISKSIYACGITVAAIIAAFAAAIVASQYNLASQVIACVFLCLIFGFIALSAHGEDL